MIALPQEEEGSETETLKSGGNSEEENNAVKLSDNDLTYGPTDLEEVSDIGNVDSNRTGR